MAIFDYSTAPTDPVKRVFWLGELERLAREELEVELGKAYFECRLQGTFETALALKVRTRTAATRLTRKENEGRGRQVRWGDPYAYR